MNFIQGTTGSVRVSKKGGKNLGFFLSNRNLELKNLSSKYMFISTNFGGKMNKIYRKNVQEKTSHMNNIVL